MPFRFGLESVLKHRQRLEEIAQREFAEAQSAVDVILKRLEAMYHRLDEVREEIAQAQGSHESDKIELVRSYEAFITGHKIRIEHTRMEARQALLVVEEKQEALIASAREKKVLQKLREKRLNEYKEHLRQLEAKALDDQTMMAQAWGKR